jgi:hypothetical protein
VRIYVLAALVALLLSCGLLAGASSGAADRQAPRDPVAHTAKTVYLREYGSLRLTKEGSETLSERGGATGTFRGVVVARLQLHAKAVDATFTIYPKGGSVTGEAHAAFVIRGSTGYYGGRLKITKATGAYRHAKGTGLGVSGTINRQTFALVVKANGWISY